LLPIDAIHFFINFYFTMDKITNPHDKLFREIWSNRKEALSFLENYLPPDILKLINPGSLEISKDTFIEEELRDFYADLLYRVKFDNDPGYIYLLFEHKSYKERLIHLQLLGYLCRIWKLHVKQTKDRRLPIIVPLVLYHGKTEWKINADFSSLLIGPYEKLKTYIPDFKFILYDLTKFSDEQIKGTLLSRIALLLLKHISDDDIMEKLPGILALFDDLLREESGLRNLETVLRYLSGALENITPDEIKTLIDHSLSGVKGDIIMTLVEKWIDEGYQKGMRQGMQKGVRQGIQQGVQQGMQQGMQRGMQQGLIEGIVLAVHLKFGSTPESRKLVAVIQKVKDIDRLKEVKNAILKTSTVPELIHILSNN